LPGFDEPQAENTDEHSESDRVEANESGESDIEEDLIMSEIESREGSGDEEEEEFFDASEGEIESERSEHEESEEEAATSSDEGEVGEEEGNQPMYDGAPITLHESLLAIFSFAIGENVSGVLLSKILELIALHCPANSLCKRTLYSLKKYFAKLGTSMLIFHYFCSECVYPLETKESACKKCKKSGSYSYFIEMPLLQQLQTLFLRPRFLEDLQYRFNRPGDPSCIRDIYDGKLYKEQFESGFLNNPHNISFMWWSDGVQVFKSAVNSSIWPLSH